MQYNASLFDVFGKCEHWASIERKDREKINQMGLPVQHLLQYAYKGGDMLSRIITGDKTGMHHYHPESKRASVQ
jgi:hypothetical protein